MKKRCVVVLYIRISMEDEDNHKNGKDESGSITHQRNMLRRYAESRQEFEGCEIVELCDDGFSGTNMDRPGMKKLLDMAKAGQADCIIVKDFSRFSRDYLILSDYVDQIFPFLGIRFISLGDGYDSADGTGPARGVDIGFRSVIYGYYSKDLSIKVKSGKLTKARKGDFINPFAPIGYRKDEKNKNRLLVEEKGASIVRRIFHMAGMGMRALEITRLLNAEKVPTPSQLQNSRGHYHKWWAGTEGVRLWDHSMVTRILRDERYLGKNIYGKRRRLQVGDCKTRKVPRSDWVITGQSHEPVVTGEEFSAAQRMLREYEEKKYPARQTHLFTGKIRCGHCRYALARKKTLSPQFYCASGKHAAGLTCMEGCIKERVVTEVILSAIRACIGLLLEEGLPDRPDGRDKKIGDLQKQIALYRAASGKIDGQKAELYDQRAGGSLTLEQFLRKRENLSGQQKTMNEEAGRLEAELAGLKNAAAPAGEGASGTEGYVPPHELTRQMVEDFVDCIYVYSDTSIHIKWAFAEREGKTYSKSKK